MQKLKTALSLAACVASSTGHAQTLNILTWEGEIADDTIAQWEAQSSVTVKRIYFDQEEVRNTILLSPDVSDIDIATIDPSTVAQIASRDVFVPIEQYHSTQNFHHFDPEMAQRCGPYATPFLWGTLGIVYRKDRVATAPTSWLDLLQPSEALRGHIGWVENYMDTLAPALLMRNQSATSDDETLLKEVFDEMTALLPAILTFDYAISYLEQSPNADALHMALAYSGDQQDLNLLSNSQQWEYVVPEEGSVIWSECLAVLKHSSKRNQAIDFINFINTPAVAAANSEAVAIASSNVTAVALQSEAFRNNPIFAPGAAQRANLVHYENEVSVRNILLRDRITSTLVELHESQ